MNIHETYIKRCIQLAKNGFGTTYPNPMVGSVIVHNGKIIGEGWHKKAGEPHAEVIAINSVKNKSLLPDSTIYVSLEPCSHFGKTPPCCDLIIKHNIKNVVIGTVDSNELVAGKGIKRLVENGIKVSVGHLEEKCYQLNQRFFTFHNKKRPYIILKWAESSDGFIAPLQKDKKEPVWLSGKTSRQLVHKYRSEEQAILVGTNTVLQDNPKLNTRDWYGKNPVRIILDRENKIDNSYFIKDNSIKTIILTQEKNIISINNCIYETVQFDDKIVQTICTVLYKHQIQSVIIEGGSFTLNAFIKANLWDEARVFISKNKLHQGVNAPKISTSLQELKKIENDQLLIYKNDD